MTEEEEEEEEEEEIKLFLCFEDLMKSNNYRFNKIHS